MPKVTSRTAGKSGVPVMLLANAPHVLRLRASCLQQKRALLKSLVLPKDDSTSETTITTKATSTTRPRSRANNTATKVAASTKKEDGLSPKEKATLATHVVNGTLRALSDYAKNSANTTRPPTPTKRQAPQEEELLRSATTRNPLQRCSSTNSTPLSPLQPRALNRVTTSPAVSKRSLSPARPKHDTNLLATVECARVALGALRQLQTSSKLTLPELQLETGMSSLIARLITLGLQDQALKELRILKKRLETLSTSTATKKTTKTTATEPSKTAAQVYTEILDFGQVKSSGPALALVITTQIQALRLLSANKKPNAIEAVIPILRQDHSSSPTSLLLRSATEKGADVSKIARQMETLAQCMISLTPSASSKDDTLSIEPRLSISPVSAIELQALALETRLQWWKLANHKGDAEKETIMPLSRYMSAFVRRSQESSRTSYATCLSAYTRVRSQLDSHGATLSQASRTPLSQIYQVLAVLAREAGKLPDAVSWATKLKEGVDPKVDSVAKICSISAQLLSLQLKDPVKYCHDGKLLEEVVAGLSGPLRGDSSDLDELLNNVCSVRRASMKLLLALIKKEKDGFADFTYNARESLESFVLQCPRFCLRWLGKPPEPKSSTKDYLRYEQRRQLLLQSIQHTLDSAFIIVKTRLEEKRLAWDFMDSILNDCLLLLEYIGDMGAASGSQQSMYHVKISHFYYLQYNVLRQQSTDPKDVAPLRALRRSIDCVKHRSAAEKEKAQLILKLERMAELARSLGRNEQALAALQTIRMSMLDDGVLGSIAAALATDSPLIVWQRDEKAETLSRALVAIAKMEHVFMDWTVDLPEPEQAAGLEHRLHYILLGGNPTMSGRKREEEITLEHPVVDALLRIYIPTRYPIRRLRVLLALLSSAIGNQRKVPELLAITRDATQVEPDNLGEDAGLARFVPHMGAFYHSITALSNGYSDLGAVQRCLETWKSIVKSCQTKTDVERSIDDIPGLLDHLQAMADFLRLSGHDHMVAMVLELTADIAKLADGPRLEDIINHASTLALQYSNLGQSIKAEQTFAETLQYLKKQADLPGDAVATFHLSWTEHFIAVGDLTQAEYHLSQARAAVEAEAMPGKVSRARRKYLVAYASYLHSLVTQERGESHHALVYARESVRCIFQDWVKVEQQLALAAKSSSARSSSPDDDNDSAMFNTAAATDDATCDLSATGKETPYLGPESWKLALTLYRNTLRLSSIYAHLGMFQETMYYAEQAQKIANSANSEILKAGCATWMGSVYVKANNVPKAMEMLQEAANLLPEESNSFSSAVLACQIGAMCLDLKSFEGAEAMVGRAESIWEGLMEVSAKSMMVVADGEKMEVGEEKGMVGLKGVKGGVVGRQVSKSVKRPGALAKPKTAAPAPAAQPVEDAQLSKLRAAILVQKATAKLAKKDWNSALAMLEGVKTRSKKSLSAIISDEQIIMASCLLGVSMEQMAHDPVFSVIQDSTISYPAVSDAHGKNRSSGGHPAVLQERKRAAAKDATDQEKAEYVDNLRQAQQSLLEAHAVATVCGDSSLIHKISVMLQNVGLLLSATASSGKAKASVQSGHTAYSVELGRNLTWRRERKALTLEKNGPKTDAYSWPNFPDLPVEPMGRMSLGFSLDLQKFQRDYIDIIPKPWSVVSISLSDNKHDLCITKLQAGCTPFVLRLPLDRASSRDADNEVFNYQQGRAELLEIIRLANETCHDARDFSIKGAKTAWWADREALDNRMKDLLTNIEQIWLGGFRGIFSQHQTQGDKRKELINKFAATFENMLDKYLPSRRQVHHRGKNNAAGGGGGQEPRSGSAAEKVTVDPRILELFIGLGDSAATATGADGQSVDLDEELTDLLYFVVDILQFHGERNAYDEIDFDSMVVEMLDALHAYHAAVNELDGDAHQQAHTILMLDKALHVFPWESLPCLQNLAVSRMPSLGCLRRAILDMKTPAQEKEEDGDSIMLDADTLPSSTGLSVQGHHASAVRGTYILNPSSDLLTTQKTFAPLLKTHLGPEPQKWTSITARPPTEPEFASALSSSDILLYFGHGSGAQYIRGRTIRRLSPRCRATVLLMGCSSAKLNEAGEGFEVYGPAWNYMMAGSPAVVGTLWDVTDRDIDRFTGRLLEEWGLFERGIFTEGEERRERMKQRRKGKGVDSDTEGGSGMRGGDDDEGGRKGGDGQKRKKSLVEAVAKARGACRFRYVTAAAVAVYGIPVYLQE
ncbi:peptidase family C50-domain-containing protein [Sordaria brevicollis]|uniref:separase n=1 Tax=Sordaria brevicollis TaxID=83679 RepID=A0AAE0U5K4_SORBR|nr:peptidase family C50-domain-containing protein [Sordaria brevicollis]